MLQVIYYESYIGYLNKWIIQRIGLFFNNTNLPGLHNEKKFAIMQGMMWSHKMNKIIWYFMLWLR